MEIMLFSVWPRDLSKSMHYVQRVCEGLFLQENILKNMSATYFMKSVSKLCIWKIQLGLRKLQNLIFSSKWGGGKEAGSKGKLSRHVCTVKSL